MTRIGHQLHPRPLGVDWRKTEPATAFSSARESARYCEMCDRWVRQVECRECGMPTRPRVKGDK